MSSSPILPPPEGPEYTPCGWCSHIEPEHRPDAGACLCCPCTAYQPVVRQPAAAPTDEDFLVALESALEKNLLPSPGVGVLERTRDDAIAALAPLVAQLRGAAAAAVRPPATDRTALRDRIRRVLCERDGQAALWGTDMLEPDEYGEAADAVLAVLPAPVDRAVVLREAADALAALDPAEAALAGQHAWNDAAQLLRRMAAVPAAVSGRADDETRGCDCPNEDAAEHMFGSDSCTCIPFIRQDGETRYCSPTDTVDMISGWEIGRDCPHHQPAVGGAQPKETDRIVAYRSALPGAWSIYCTRHTSELGDGVIPLTTDDLPDGGLCASCGVDVLIPQQPKEAGA